MRHLLLSTLTASCVLLLGGAVQAQTTGTGNTGNPGTAGNTGNTGNGLNNVRFPTMPDPNYDGRGPLAAASGALFGAPLGALSALGMAWWITGPEDSLADNLIAGQVGALLGNALGIGSMILVAWSTDRDSLGDAPFLIIPPAFAIAGGILTPLLWKGLGEGSPATQGEPQGWSVAPWLGSDAGGMSAVGRW